MRGLRFYFFGHELFHPYLEAELWATMNNIKYIHAADLHLDAAFTGLARAGNEELAARLADSTFVALENLTRLCEAEQPDFLLLAGDIYNHEDYSVRAQLRVAKIAKRMCDLGIPIYISYGNHDPLSSRLRSVRFPDNVVEFGAEPEARPVTRDSETIALVHGASHATNLESRNLAQLFHRDPGAEGCFQIGLLHCNADGAVKDDRYAPCSVRDLVESGLDAWALGHAHKRQILSDSPFIAYSGCSQGIRPTENGAKGCLVVNAFRAGHTWRCDALFRQLGPIVWTKMDIDVTNARTLNDAIGLIQNEIQNALEDTEFCDGLIADVNFTGSSPLAAELVRPGACEDLVAEAADSFKGNCEIWPGAIHNSSRPHDQISILDRDDLLGEIARIGQRYAGDSDSLRKIASTALHSLYGAHRYRGILAEPDSDEILVLLQKAQTICQNLLENR